MGEATSAALDRGQPRLDRAPVAPARNQRPPACCQSASMSEAPLSTTWILSGPERATQFSGHEAAMLTSTPRRVPGRLLVGAGRPERSAIGTEQEQGIRSRLPALIRQQQTEQRPAAALRPGRPSGRAAAVGS